MIAPRTSSSLLVLPESWVLFPISVVFVTRLVAPALAIPLRHLHRKFALCHLIIRNEFLLIGNLINREDRMVVPSL